MTSDFLRTISEAFQEGQRNWKNTFQLGGRFSRYWSKISWRSLVVVSVAFKLKLYVLLLHLGCSFPAQTTFTGPVHLNVSTVSAEYILVE